VGDVGQLLVCERELASQRFGVFAGQGAQALVELLDLV
jgi:hypothetical protein